VSFIPILFCAWVVFFPDRVSSLLPFPISVATVSYSVNRFPVPSGSPSCLDPIFIRCFYSRVPRSRLGISLLFSSARSGLGHSCFLFACGTSRCPIQAGSSSTGSRVHHAKTVPAAASAGQRSFSCQQWFPVWILSPCQDLVLMAVLRSVFLAS
jgi:hypothetical protein